MIALDASVRTISADGHLQIARTRISKATVNPYYGHEVPGGVEMGLDPNRLYFFLRDPNELTAGAQSFAEKPVMIIHQPINAEDHPREVVVGTTGSVVEFEDPYLWTSLTIWDQEGIDGIDDNSRREISAAYRWLPLMTPGEYQGQRYDGVMTNLIGNHVALVKAGRAGSDVLAADSKEKKPMTMTRKGNALKLALGALSPKIAQDAALPSLVEHAGNKGYDKNKLKTALPAMDEDVDKDKLMDVIDAILEDDPAEDSEEETEEEKEKRLKKEKEEDKKAMDSAIATATSAIRAEMRDAEEARRLVRPVVGDVIAQDTAAGIYGFALSEMKIAHDGVSDPTALKAIFVAGNAARTVQPAKTGVAMDATAQSNFAKEFPNALRFTHA